MFSDKQQQNAGAGAVAVQSLGNVDLRIGMTVEEVRAVALQAVKAEFYQLSQMAADTASGRAQRICDDFLEKLQKENPDGLRRANEPDFQYALFAAQKAYAQTGNEDLEPLLVSLLVARTKEDSQNLRQIVLSESIEVISKITNGQISALAIVFLLKRTVSFQIRSFEAFLSYCDGHIKPFVNLIATGSATYRHLQFANCGAVDIGESSFYSIIEQSYPGILQTGFVEDLIPASLGLIARQLIVRSSDDPYRFHVHGRNEDDLLKMCQDFNIPDADKDILIGMMRNGRLTEVQIERKLREARPYLSELLTIWKTSEMKSFNLTSVGMAIAHAAVKQHVPSYSDLSIWID